ncbi:RNA recognition motif 2-domain-containing protein, partial [Mycena pura]
RPHPPRLQHSPSMPNIWFPPHSGPIPSQLIETCRDLFKRPPTPSSNDQKPVDDCDVSVHTPAADEEPSRRQCLPASTRRSHINYDQPNILLTPPLTPSSSIRTATSIESNVSYKTGVANLQRPPREEDISDPDTNSTRFLIIGNVSRKVTSEDLQFVIMQSLDVSKTRATVTTGSVHKITGSEDHVPPFVKVNLRFRESKGVAILAFFDIRRAKSAHVILSTPTTGALAQCVEDQQKWLSCSFVTAEDLIERMGNSNSPFLVAQGFFLLAVEVVAGPSAASEIQVFHNKKVERPEINISTLINLLKAQGELRSFGFAHEILQTAPRKVFRVEYYDVRETENAIPALNDKVYFGMRLTVLGHGPQSSRMRERLFIDTAGKTRLRSVSTGHESLEGSRSPPFLVPASSDSPPFFYTSPPTSPSTGVSQTPDHQNLRASSHLFDAIGRPVSGQPQQSARRSRSVSFDSGAGAEREHDQQDKLAVVPYSPNLPTECCYAPLERFPHPYYNGCPTPLPTAFPYAFPPHHAQLITSYPPYPLGYVHDYDQAHLVNVGNWTFEQAMMMPPSPFGMYTGMPYPPIASPGSEYWLDSPVPSPQQLAYFHYPPIPSDSPPLPKLQSPAHPSLSYGRHLPSPTSPPAAPSPRAVVPTSGPPSPNGNNNNERNQLNLARIEDGQDTRTTVMIKNIPNKMSDKDLLAYISRVCDRRIDFLYLRMDFQNGCNVGYAFVNFITVQDLLRFAKAKLGEKWNMFSSEKVLQMSYANYQGKEALVEKFKNSCIMDEKPAWQPKIFYSDGVGQGLPEPFPPPTHLRRKERSSYNRGPLYVPGTMQSLSPQARRQQAEDRDRMSGRHNERPRR